VKLLTFDEAVADARRLAMPRPTVLLGNGFSIDYDPSIFSYSSLAKRARLDELHMPKKELFEAVGSENFEIVSERLQRAATVHRLYDPSGDLWKGMKQDAAKVRRSLAHSLATLHPDSARDLTDAQAAQAKRFLRNFRLIYTVNYDLLLYWVLNAPGGPAVVKRDGFERREDDPGPLFWKPNPDWGSQQVFYLHGALHLFVKDKRLEKLNGRDHGRLVDALRRRLRNKRFPRVVTEGRSDEKLARIAKSAYLSAALQSFRELHGTLFIHGMSLSENDDHLLTSISAGNSRVTGLYVGVHGHPSRSSKVVVDRARSVKADRVDNGGQALRLRFYDAASARVWR
jgi:hypothetical protein